MRIVRRYRVHGRVQGVGFRAFVWRLAGSMAVEGWVRNRCDGTVEALMAADPEVQERVLAGLREGPRLSRVDRVEVADERDASDVGAGFSMRHDA